ncbi:hypothetical protein SEQ01_18120 [Streptococcus equinus]|uniref:hypothetical protein n=1 Tax=Streptococcus equinus TaxID=1335 RepID=UPI0011420226|nr:hypothetical protein [Streptococcus equinus]GEB11621.1 hypothetical protein SEQ01_18120 [Streptococcus equinus]
MEKVTKFFIEVTENDEDEEHLSYKTKLILIAETLGEAKERARKLVDRHFSCSGYSMVVYKIEDVVVETKMKVWSN